MPKRLREGEMIERGPRWISGVLRDAGSEIEDILPPNGNMGVGPMLLV